MERLNMGHCEDDSYSTDRFRVDLYDRPPAPTRCEINSKICLCFILSVILSTFGSVAVVHILRRPATAPQQTALATGVQMRQAVKPTQTPQSKPYAHLTVDVLKPKKMENGILVVGWKRMESKHIGGGMEHNNSDVLIPENGFYVIYLQLSFQSIQRTCKDDVVHLNHNVTKRSQAYNTPRTIITNWETVTCREIWFKTIHNTARLFLRKGDRLQVTLSPSCDGLIDSGGQPWTKTFWGVYLDQRDIK